jgi:antitoxin YobK
MSLEAYNQAKQIILSNNEQSDFVGPCSKEFIVQAEQKLGLKFTGSYLDFLLSFGAGNFGAEEIYGIISNDFENSSIPDAIWYTITERRESKLPKNLLIIYDTGSDEVYCLDFNKIDNKEPKVVSFVPGIAIENQTYEIIANNFGDMLLDLVTQEL